MPAHICADGASAMTASTRGSRAATLRAASAPSEVPTMARWSTWVSTAIEFTAERLQRDLPWARLLADAAEPSHGHRKRSVLGEKCCTVSFDCTTRPPEHQDPGPARHVRLGHHHVRIVDHNRRLDRTHHRRWRAGLLHQYAGGTQRPWSARRCVARSSCRSRTGGACARLRQFRAPPG